MQSLATIHSTGSGKFFVSYSLRERSARDYPSIEKATQVARNRGFLVQLAASLRD